MSKIKHVREVVLDQLYCDLQMTRDRIGIAEENLETAKSEYHQAVDHFNNLNELIGEIEGE